MPDHLLGRYLECFLVGVADTSIRKHDVQASCHPLDLFHVVFLVRGREFDDMKAVGV